MFNIAPWVVSSCRSDSFCIMPQLDPTSVLLHPCVFIRDAGTMPRPCRVLCLEAIAHSLTLCNPLRSDVYSRLSPPSQEAVDATIEVVKTLNEKVFMHAQIILDSCAYAGTGNVLKVQRLLSICGDHLEEDKTPGGVAHQVGDQSNLIFETFRKFSGIGHRISRSMLVS